jgi:hypothetical protein
MNTGRSPPMLIFPILNGLAFTRSLRKAGKREF